MVGKSATFLALWVTRQQPHNDKHSKAKLSSLLARTSLGVRHLELFYKPIVVPYYCRYYLNIIRTLGKEEKTTATPLKSLACSPTLCLSFSKYINLLAAY